MPLSVLNAPTILYPGVGDGCGERFRDTLKDFWEEIFVLNMATVRMPAVVQDALKDWKEHKKDEDRAYP